MPIYDQISQSQANVTKIQQIQSVLARSCSTENAWLLTQASDHSKTSSESQNSSEAKTSTAPEQRQVLIYLVIPFTMSLPEAWVDHAPKGEGGPRKKVYADGTSARIETWQELPNGEDNDLGLLIPKAPNRLIFDESKGAASALAKKFAGLVIGEAKYNQLTRHGKVAYHICRIETITVGGQPAVRYSIRCQMVGGKWRPEELVTIPLAMGEKKKFLPGRSASDQSIWFSASNDSDFNGAKGVFEDAVRSIRGAGRE